MKKFICLICCFCFLTGCTTEQTNQITSTVQNAVEQLQKTGYKEVGTISETESVVSDTLYEYTDKLPVIKDNKLIGYFTVSQIEKLGIWDWNNKKAVSKKIKHCYAINLKFHKAEGVQDTFSVACTPSLISKSGKTVGSICRVGWSGFPEVIDVYPKDTEKSLEVCVQPEIKDEKGVKLQLQFSDIRGNKLNSVTLKNSVFKEVVKGPSLKTSKPTFNITTKNGGKYSVQLKKILKSENTRDGVVSQYLDFGYTITYKKSPTRKITSSRFDSNNKNALRTSMVIGVQVNDSSQFLYESFYNVYRLDAYGRHYAYIKDGKDTIALKKSTTYMCNRLLNESQNKVKYARFSLEFPEEVECRTDEELLKFNGRYQVYQTKVKVRDRFKER